jgi:hypothetical protein
MKTTGNTTPNLGVKQTKKRLYYIVKQIREGVVVEGRRCRSIDM